MPAPQSSTPGQVAGVVSFYMTAALVMVFVNKAVLNSSPDLPLLFLFLQMVIAVILLHLTAAVFPKRVDLPKLDLDAAKKLTPVVAVNIIGLVFNTLCLRDVDASFFQIARGMVLPMTIAASSMSTRSTPTGRVLGAAGIVTIGFLLGISPASLMPSRFASTTSQAPSVSFMSLIYGLLSSLFIAVHSVLIKSSLPHCNGSTIHLAYWTNLGSAIFVAPFVVLKGEPWRVLDLLASNAIIGAVDVWNVRVFVIGSLVTGTFGFLLCVAGLLSIKVTSPITHMFSSVSLSFSSIFVFLSPLLFVRTHTSVAYRRLFVQTPQSPITFRASLCADKIYLGWRTPIMAYLPHPPRSQSGLCPPRVRIGRKSNIQHSRLPFFRIRVGILALTRWLRDAPPRYYHSPTFQHHPISHPCIDFRHETVINQYPRSIFLSTALASSFNVL